MKDMRLGQREKEKRNEQKIKIEKIKKNTERSRPLPSRSRRDPQPIINRMATAPMNASTLDVDGPEDLDEFVKELMENMVRRTLTSFVCLGEVVLPFLHVDTFTSSCPNNSFQLMTKLH